MSFQNITGLKLGQAAITTSYATGNAVFYNAALPAYSTLQWCGMQILNAGDTIQVKASATGCTITASGGEAL